MKTRRSQAQAISLCEQVTSCEDEFSFIVWYNMLKRHMRSHGQPYVPMDYSGTYADICQLWNDTIQKPHPNALFSYKTTSSAVILSYHRSFSPLPIRTGWGDPLMVDTNTAVQVDHVLHEPQPDHKNETPLSTIHLRLLLDKELMPSDRYRKAMQVYLKNMENVITDYGITSLSDTYIVHQTMEKDHQIYTAQPVPLISPLYIPLA